MSDELLSREYKPGDETQILDLLASTFPDWERRKNPLDHWRWKYLDAPFGKMILITEVNDIIRFHGAEIFFRVKICDDIVLTTYGDDYVTHPDFRGKGLWSASHDIAKMRLAEIDHKAAYAITTNKIVIARNIKNKNFGFPYKFIHLMRIKDMNLHMKEKNIESSALKKQGFNVLKIYNRMRMITKKDNDKFTVEKIDIFNDKIDELWESVKDRYKYILERKKEFLNWRFCDKRGGNNTVYTATNNGKILGYIAFGVKDDDTYPEGYIMDLLTVGDPEVAYQLIFKALETFDNQHINTIHYRAIKDSEYTDILKRTGFIELPQLVKVMIPLDVKDPKLKEEFTTIKPREIHFNISDYL